MKINVSRVCAFAVAVAFAAGVTPSAQAAVITFDDLGIGVATQLSPAEGVGVVSNGFTYTPGPDDNSGFNDLHIDNGEIGPWNGTASGGTHDDVILAKQGGGTFSIQSFDYAGFAGGEVPFRVVGNLSGGGQLFASFSPDGVSDNNGPDTDFETFLFGPDWTNLESVVWHHTGGVSGIFYLDNIEVDQVPEPMTLTLMGLATAGFLARRRLNQR